MRTAWYRRAVMVGEDAAYEMVQTHRGPVTHLQLLESQAFHAAQHLRQIGIAPVDELTAAEMAPVILGDLIF